MTARALDDARRAEVAGNLDCAATLAGAYIRRYGDVYGVDWHAEASLALCLAAARWDPARGPYRRWALFAAARHLRDVLDLARRRRRRLPTWPIEYGDDAPAIEEPGYARADARLDVAACAARDPEGVALALARVHAGPLAARLGVSRTTFYRRLGTAHSRIRAACG